jgi:hypothetical protein
MRGIHVLDPAKEHCGDPGKRRRGEKMASKVGQRQSFYVNNNNIILMLAGAWL